jgi:hypothetical protein
MLLRFTGRRRWRRPESRKAALESTNSDSKRDFAPSQSYQPSPPLKHQRPLQGFEPAILFLFIYRESLLWVILATVSRGSKIISGVPRNRVRVTWETYSLPVQPGFRE